MTRAHEDPELAEAFETSELARSLLRASADALLDPHVLVEASRDSDGRIVDFVYREVNQATCDYLGLSREELLGRGIVGTTPGVMASGLFAAGKHCLETGQPLILDDYSYDNEILSDTRRYVRATRATPTSPGETSQSGPCLRNELHNQRRSTACSPRMSVMWSAACATTPSSGSPNQSTTFSARRPRSNAHSPA